jgi:hypothetical protein
MLSNPDNILLENYPRLVLQFILTDARDWQRNQLSNVFSLALVYFYFLPFEAFDYHASMIECNFY